MKSILLVFGESPAANNPRVLDAAPDCAFADTVKSPKSCELPRVEIVINSITLVPGFDPPPFTPRVPRPVFDPVPPPRFGVTNSN